MKAVCAAEKTKDVLDYGCGKGALVEAIKAEGYDARGYDPCVEKYSAPPEPADVVICTDVLEHVEPEHIEEVLNDLQRLTKRAIYLSVSTHLAMKTLPDGRNAHLIVKHSNAWLVDLLRRFRVVKFSDHGRGFMAICVK